ncbi:MAG: aminotransferase class I/II-fold pyridoxal phosphate-dependent enzyme, partial [Candidatus Rokubacteria bacterium]|nr:aminotransferase class I/II-fold pyridoxal phosphate-dependent enzyme [Candidatus Rokubacteria bacterium]
MTRVVNHYGGVNLAQGMPNFRPPQELLDAAHRALDGDFHQYAITWGTPRLRRAIADKYRKFYGMEVEPDRHVTVCCGSTETMLSSLLAGVDRREERGDHRLRGSAGHADVLLRIDVDAVEPLRLRGDGVPHP